MASLQAGNSLRSAHPLFFINKLASLTAFIVLLGVGWVALSYLKSDAFDRRRGGSPATVSASSKSGTAQANEASSPEGKQLAAPGRLVYSCAADKDFYHASMHLPARCERTALGEEGAIQRGLKRCKSCFPD